VTDHSKCYAKFRRLVKNKTKLKRKSPDRSWFWWNLAEIFTRI